MKTYILGFVLWLFLSPSVFALSLQEAKSSGFIGEKNTGYLGEVSFIVSMSSLSEVDVKAIKNLVLTINKKRKVFFSKAANNAKVDLSVVEKRFYKRAVIATKMNQYYQESKGDWVKK
jgi:uncharacterized protein YdbL (DUF1318 family)